MTPFCGCIACLLTALRPGAGASFPSRPLPTYSNDTTHEGTIGPDLFPLRPVFSHEGISFSTASTKTAGLHSCTHSIESLVAHERSSNASSPKRVLTMPFGPCCARHPLSIHSPVQTTPLSGFTSYSPPFSSPATQRKVLVLGSIRMNIGAYLFPHKYYERGDKGRRDFCRLPKASVSFSSYGTHGIFQGSGLRTSFKLSSLSFPPSSSFA